MNAHQAHVAELERRHRALDQEIKAEEARPGGDDTRIAALKRKKLFIKDELARLALREGVGG